MRTLSLWLLCGALAAAAARATEPPAAAPLAIARSTLIVLEVSPSGAGLALRLRYVRDHTPVAVSELAASIDGQPQAAVVRADGSWLVPLPARAGSTPLRLEVVVAHDGIRELLSGELPVAGAGNAAAAAAPAATPAAGAHHDGGLAGALRAHKQMLWWILNIGVVLIGVVALSRRMS